MEHFPSVKGWQPFVAVEKDLIKAERRKLQKEKNPDELVDVPKDWKTPPFKFEDNPHKRLFASTTFKVLFPSKLATYLKEVFPVAQKAIEEHFIKARLILNDGEMTVETTQKTFDPVMILRARSVINLLSRYVPIKEAIRVLEDDITEDIITIGHRKHDTFHRRRSRLLDPEINEAIKEILDCNIYVAGKTVAAIGSYSNLARLRTLVDACFVKNIHPIYSLKQMMMQNKLKSMPEMEGKDWSSFMPKMPKKNVKTKKPFKVREKKEYDPFPPALTESKIDKDLESGLFHLKYAKKPGKSHFELIDKVRAKEDEKKKRKDEARKDAEKVSETVKDSERKSDDIEKGQPKSKKLKKE